MEILGCVTWPSGHRHLDLTVRAVRSADFDDLPVRAVDGLIAGGTLPPLGATAYGVVLRLADDRPVLVGDHLAPRVPVADDASISVRVLGDVLHTIDVVVEQRHGYTCRLKDQVCNTSAD